MLADELHRDLAAAAEWDIGELGAGRLFDGDGDDLVFLLGAGAAHLELAGLLLGGLDVFLNGSCRAVGITQRMNSSSAIMATGVMSFQLNGMPVASGVVNRLDSVMMSLCGLLRDSFTSRKPSPPAPPDLLMTTIGCFIRSCLVTMPWMVRAI